MRKRRFLIGILLCIHPMTYSHAESLKEAMERAARQHPLLQMADRRVDAARGERMEQGAYAYNPELSLEPQRRRLNGGGTANDYYISLSQGIEVGGKRGLREQSAKASLNAVLAGRENTRQQLMIQAARAYVMLAIAERTYDLRAQQSTMLQQVSRAVALQLELGQSSQLDANLAQSAYASALNATATAKQLVTQSRQAYRLALGQGGAADSSLSILELPTLRTEWRPPADAYHIALESRPDLTALRSKVTQAAAQAELADAQRIPDIALSVMAGREAGDRLIKFGVTVPFPVFNSHLGAYHAALANKRRVDAGLAWSKQQLRYAVESAVANHANAMRALADMERRGMQRNAEETITLAQKAYDAGELDLEELVVHIKQGLDARMTALNIIQQGWLARIRLAEVLGRPEYILKGIQP